MSSSRNAPKFADGSYMDVDGNGNLTLFSKTGVAVFTINANGTVSKATTTTLSGTGFPLIIKVARQVAQTIAVTNLINQLPGAAAGMVFRLSAMVNVTAWTTPASFTMVATYTDDQGGAQTETLATFEGDGTSSALIDEVERFYAVPLIISPDASNTAITLSTTGTFTGSPVYSFLGILERFA